MDQNAKLAAQLAQAEEHLREADARLRSADAKVFDLQASAVQSSAASASAVASAVERLWTPLHEALNDGQFKDAQVILQSPEGPPMCAALAPVEHKMVGCSVLHIAAFRSPYINRQMAGVLCDTVRSFDLAIRKEILEAVDRNRQTALVLAASVGNPYSVARGSAASVRSVSVRPHLFRVDLFRFDSSRFDGSVSVRFDKDSSSCNSCRFDSV